MKKSEVINQLRAIKNNFLLTQIATGLIGTKEIHPYIKQLRATFKYKNKKIDFDFQEMPKLLENEVYKKAALFEFVKMGFKAFITETYKIIMTYCEDTSQLELFKEQDWYHFAKHIRNALSHNDRFDLHTVPEESFPIRWKNKIITKDMHDKPLTFSFFSIINGIELHNEMELFVREELNEQ